MESLIIALILFLVADFSIRRIIRWHKKRRDRMVRQKALSEGIRNLTAENTPSLKRVDLPEPAGRILCVDDEEMILDSLRKILVMEGYAVDTVTIGSEALRLLQMHHYDLTLVDLKMPGIDGVTLSGKIAQVRPDVDIIIITGYPSIESAVETMKSGAADYLQKPFTSQELLQVVTRQMKKRQMKFRQEVLPRIRVAPLKNYTDRCTYDFIIPGGVFISRNHCWVHLNPDGTVNVGVDDFARKIIGSIDHVELPVPGLQVGYSTTLFVLHRKERCISFASPVIGQVIKANTDLSKNIKCLDESTYGRNWFCQIRPDNIEKDLDGLMIGRSAMEFYQREVEDCCSQFRPMVSEQKSDKKAADGNGSFWGRLVSLPDRQWNRLNERFFGN